MALYTVLIHTPGAIAKFETPQDSELFAFLHVKDEAFPLLTKTGVSGGGERTVPQDPYVFEKFTQYRSTNPLCLIQIRESGKGLQCSVAPWVPPGAEEEVIAWCVGSDWEFYENDPYPGYREHVGFHLNHKVRDLFGSARKEPVNRDHDLMKAIAGRVITSKRSSVAAAAREYEKIAARPQAAPGGVKAVFEHYWKLEYSKDQRAA